MNHLTQLARPFPSNYVKDNPTGFGSYVAHHIVNQRLLQVVGPFNWQLVEIIRGVVPAVEHTDAKKAKPQLDNAIVGVVYRLTVTIDDRLTIVEECGDCEQPHNWPHDGARLKDAISDAIKRCAMRPSLGLSLWSQKDYFLYDALMRDEGLAGEGDRPPEGANGRDSVAASPPAEVVS